MFNYIFVSQIKQYDVKVMLSDYYLIERGNC